MAYKYAKGKIYRGDIYNEDDTQRNTFIDFSEDAVGIIVGNAEGLVVSGSGAVSSSLNVSASGFYGDGSGLSGITATSSPAGSDGQIQFNDESSTGGAAQLYWHEGNNRLGIGTSNPTRVLDIEHADSAGIQLNATNHRAYTLASDSYGFTIFDDSTGGTPGYRFVISDQAAALGYVGIGAGASIAGSRHPDALLHLSSSDDGAIFRADTTDGTTVLFATGSGRVGIGTASPSTTLHAYADVSDAYVALIDNDAGSNAHGLKITSDGTGTGTTLLDVEAGSTTVFKVRGDGRVGIGVATPGSTLSVDDEIAVGEKLLHRGDPDTYLQFPGQNQLVLAANSYAFLTYDGSIKINNANRDRDTQIMSDDGSVMLHVDAGTNRVGVATTSPTSTFEISGSQAGNYTQTAGNITFTETHYVVDYTGNGNATFTLPASSGVTGRQYHILSHAQGGGDTLTVTGSGGAFQGAHLEGDSTSVNIDGNTPQSLTVLSTGTNWFILHDGRTQE